MPSWPAPSTMALVIADGADAVIVLANDATLTVTGYAPDSLLGRPLARFLDSIGDPHTAAAMAGALSAGIGGGWEFACRRADRSTFPAAVALTVARDAAGHRGEVYLSILALHGTAQGLADQREDFYRLYEQAPGFIAMSQGPDHRFIFANASYKRFVGRENLLGRIVAEAIPEIVEQGFIDLLDQVYRTGEVFLGRNMPMNIRNPVTGLLEARRVDFIYEAMRDANHAITGLFCEGYDLTQRHEAANALHALQSEMIYHSRVNTMGTMATRLAHELNQPLSAIANYSAGILRLLVPTTDAARKLIEAMEGIREASWRAAEIIRNLNDLTGRRKGAQVVFDLQPAVTECVRLVRATVSPSIRLVEAIPPGMQIEADRVQIQQVIINLLRNACEAVTQTGVQMVTIEARLDGEKVVISVADTGSGVSMEAARSLFMPGESLKSGGMGLGLSICRSILDAHMGRIWLDHSDAHGSTFCFSLPRVAAANTG